MKTKEEILLAELNKLGEFNNILEKIGGLEIEAIMASEKEK